VEGTQVWFYSRSREDLWHKGEISGNYLNLEEAWLDCDSDTILLKVKPDGPACHTGDTSCFFTPMDQLPDEYEVTETGAGILSELFAVIQDRQRDPTEGSYTAKLLQQGVSRVAQKVIEEAGETAIAAVQGNTEDLPKEVADLLYHTLVLLAASGVAPGQVWEELRQRRK
jgi:phosphoribosyl-ATP pyrophosphohydrolase/phosphoribosyl-AMP cyclohydrolase